MRNQTQSNPSLRGPHHAGSTACSRPGPVKWAAPLLALLLTLLSWHAPGMGLFPKGSVSAQSSARVELYPPDTSQFPDLVVPAVVHDPAGNLVSGLSAADITVLENGSRLPAEIVEEERRGVTFAVVINDGAALGARDHDGRTRYELISETLQIWAMQGARSEEDEYGLFTPGQGGASGSEPSSHLLLSAWLEAFNAYRPTLTSIPLTLDTINAAIDALPAPAASTAGLAPERVILWITPLPEGVVLDELPSLAQRLKEAGIHLFIWSASPPSAFESPGASVLNDLALSTGGQYFPFSGPEALPDLETYLAPLRSFYRVHYHSAVISPGDQTLALEVKMPDGGDLTSDTQSFVVNVAPPNPMLVSPPVAIRRTAPAGSAHPLENLQPVSQSIRILVEFPDKNPRPLTATRLYVDGKVAGENLAEPFDQFTWDLSAYTTSGVHRLKVEAVDDLGFSKESVETPVQITIVLPEPGLIDKIRASLSPAAWVGVALVAAMLVTGAAAGARRLIRKIRLARQKRRSEKPAVKGNRPASLPESRAFPAGSRPAHRPVLDGKPLAHLAPLDEAGLPLPGPAIAITGREITLGREASQASMALDSPTVDGLHARLRLGPDGAYTLYDLGSVAGTWVNYTLIPPEGVKLGHGDLIHVGRLAFRFEYQEPERLPKPTIRPYNEGA